MRRLLLAVPLLAVMGCAAARPAQRVTPVPTTPATLHGYAASLLHAEAVAHRLGGPADYLSTGQALRTRAGLLETIAPPQSLAVLHGRLLDAAQRMAALGPRAAPAPATGVVPCYAASPVASAGCSERNLRVDSDALNRYNRADNDYAIARREIAERLDAVGIELPRPAAVSVR
jgi:hypothetical protein